LFLKSRRSDLDSTVTNIPNYVDAYIADDIKFKSVIHMALNTHNWYLEIRKKSYTLIFNAIMVFWCSECNGLAILKCLSGFIWLAKFPSRMQLCSIRFNYPSSNCSADQSVQLWGSSISVSAIQSSCSWITCRYMISKFKYLYITSMSKPSVLVL